MAGDGSHVKAAQVARRMGVTTQAASEMFRRLAADGLVNQKDGRELVLTGAGRAAADAIFRRHALLEWLLTSVVGLGWARVGRGGDAAPGRDLAAGRGPARRDARPPGDVPARQPDRRRDRAPPPAGTPLSARSRPATQATSTGSPRRPRRTRACCRTSRRGRSRPAPTMTILARSESLDSLTLEGPRGRATLGLRPAALVRVLPARPTRRCSTSRPRR